MLIREERFPNAECRLPNDSGEFGMNGEWSGPGAIGRSFSRYSTSFGIRKSEFGIQVRGDVPADAALRAGGDDALQGSLEFGHPLRARNVRVRRDARDDRAIRPAADEPVPKAAAGTGTSARQTDEGRVQIAAFGSAQARECRMQNRQRGMRSAAFGFAQARDC